MIAVSDMIKLAITIIFCVFISAYDVRAFRIPNEALYVFFLILFVHDIKYDYSGIVNNICSSLLFFLLFTAIRYFLGGLGGGDVKFVGVLAYELGLSYSPPAFFIASVFGLTYMATVKFIGKKKADKIPFAPFLSSGAIVMLTLRIL